MGYSTPNVYNTISHCSNVYYLSAVVYLWISCYWIPIIKCPFVTSRFTQAMEVDCITENTADLCLHLEDDSTVTSPIKDKQNSPSTPVKKPRILLETNAVFKNEVTNKEPIIQSSKTVQEKGATGLTTTSCVSPLRPNNSCIKAPRRVALITLASPKSKKTFPSNIKWGNSKLNHCLIMSIFKDLGSKICKLFVSMTKLKIYIYVYRCHRRFS